MSELMIKGINYRTGNLDAKKQWHVARRLAPVLSGFSEGFRQIRGKLEAQTNNPPEEGQENGPSEEEKRNVDDALITVARPVADALSKMSDADTEYVLDLCLNTCTRQSPENNQWARITARDGSILFKDIDMEVMLQLVFAVIEDNLGNFLPVSLRQFTEDGR